MDHTYILTCDTVLTQFSE